MSEREKDVMSGLSILIGKLCQILVLSRSYINTSDIVSVLLSYLRVLCEGRGNEKNELSAACRTILFIAVH